MTPPRGLLGGGGGYYIVWYWGGEGELISGEFIDVIVLVFRVIGRGILVAQDIDVWCVVIGVMVVMGGAIDGIGWGYF